MKVYWESNGEFKSHLAQLPAIPKLIGFVLHSLVGPRQQQKLSALNEQSADQWRRD
jgi:hypothetical protein